MGLQGDFYALHDFVNGVLNEEYPRMERVAQHAGGWVGLEGVSSVNSVAGLVLLHLSPACEDCVRECVAAARQPRLFSEEEYGAALDKCC